ncbi:hypothetical protein HZS_840 [Henneguya salminicola]|nr:hypothetical protein HZS_840 [Henneguya salminicola]
MKKYCLSLVNIKDEEEPETDDEAQTTSHSSIMDESRHAPNNVYPYMPTNYQYIPQLPQIVVQAQPPPVYVFLFVPPSLPAEQNFKTVSTSSNFVPPAFDNNQPINRQIPYYSNQQALNNFFMEKPSLDYLGEASSQIQMLAKLIKPYLQAENSFNVAPVQYFINNFKDNKKRRTNSEISILANPITYENSMGYGSYPSTYKTNYEYMLKPQIQTPPETHYEYYPPQQLIDYPTRNYAQNPERTYLSSPKRKSLQSNKNKRNFITHKNLMQRSINKTAKKIAHENYIVNNSVGNQKTLNDSTFNGDKI